MLVVLCMSGSEHLTPFLEQSVAEVEEILSLNTRAATLLTRSLLPDMLARGRGAVINITSVAASQPMPYIAVYAATKAEHQILS